MEANERETSRRRRAYLILFASFVLLGVAVLLSTLAAVALVWRENARRERCDANFARLYMAAAEYADANGAFPPAFTADRDGRKLHSWRVLLLPFLGESELFAQIRLDEPWDSDWNSQFHSRTPNVFRCASTPDSLLTATDKCAVSAVWGDSTVFPANGRSVAPSEILDGTANTILFVERKSPVCWMNPDAELTQEQVLTENGKPAKERVDFGSWHGSGGYVVYCDGRRQFLSEKIDENVLKLLFDVADSAPNAENAEPPATESEKSE